MVLLNYYNVCISYCNNGTGKYLFLLVVALYLPAKPLHNHDIASVHLNNFYCMGICDKLSRHLYMLTYIYLNMDEC